MSGRGRGTDGTAAWGRQREAVSPVSLCLRLDGLVDVSFFLPLRAVDLSLQGQCDVE